MRSTRVACDSLVALGTATADGAVWFAKNSDRPAGECQPLADVPHRRHAADDRLRCTYIEIPQVAETARVIGSRPYWLWGFEHGVNEHGVAIGNHTVFSKDPIEGIGLIGMDLVRLGLERGASAAQAVEVMTALIEQYGQGGSGYVDKDWPYHNSFLIADRASAFALEASDRRWAVRRVTDVASLSNHLTIGSDWDAVSDGAIEHAIAAGWWDDRRDDRFDFAAAYRDTTLVPDVISIGRHQRTCALLEASHGRIDFDVLRAALRDHYGARIPPLHRTPAEPEYFSVCMHADPVGTTTASMIARLPADVNDMPMCWASLGSPCLGAFVPLFFGATVPSALTTGGEQPSADSAWWQMKGRLTLVERDWPVRAPRVRAAFDAFERRTSQPLTAGAIRGTTSADKSAFSDRLVQELLGITTELAREFERD